MQGSAAGNVKRMYTVGMIPAVDRPILSQLPPEGSLVMGIKPLGMTVKGIAAGLGGALTSNEVSGRMVSMKAQGMVVSVQLIPSTKGLGWQITPLGQEWLANDSDDQGGTDDYFNSAA